MNKSTESPELAPDETQDCPLCNQRLKLSEFGICRSRKSGRNLYCKACIRKKVTDSRQALREYKSARKRYVTLQSVESTDASSADNKSNAAQPVTRVVSKLSPVERVRKAIKEGNRTQRQIRNAANESKQYARLGDDEVGDAITQLLLWERAIRTQVIDNTRMYFIIPDPAEESSLPRRKPDVQSSFSALSGLMPGKIKKGIVA